MRVFFFFRVLGLSLVVGELHKTQFKVGVRKLHDDGGCAEDMVVETSY